MSMAIRAMLDQQATRYFERVRCTTAEEPEDSAAAGPYHPYGHDPNVQYDDAGFPIYNSRLSSKSTILGLNVSNDGDTCTKAGEYGGSGTSSN